MSESSVEQPSVTISVALVNEILNHLAKEPYHGVYVLIQKIQKEASDSLSVVQG
jgi:hypothetical protein